MSTTTTTTAATRLLRSHWLALAVLALATLAATWPWSLTDASFPARDTAFTLLAMDHLQEVVLGRASLHEAPLAWPWSHGITQSDWVLGQALAALPLRGLPPLAVHEILTFAGLLATAWAVHLAARVLTGPGPHTWIAGAMGGLHPVQLVHVQHLNLVHHELAVLATLAVAVGLHRKHAWLAGVGGLVAALGFHLGFYVGMHGLLAVGVVLPVALVAGRGDVRSWGAVGVGLAVGALTVAPVALLYQEAALTWDIAVDTLEVRGWSWRLGRTLLPVEGAPLHAPLQHLADGLLRDPLYQRNPANPGYGAALLAVAGLWVLRRKDGPRWPWVAVLGVALISALLALGPDVAVFDPDHPIAPGLYRLLELLPGMGGLRAPARWLAVCFTALALVGALGARSLLGGVPPVWRGLLAAALCMLPALEGPPPPVAPASAMALHPIYAELALVDEPGALWDEALVRNPACGCRGGHALRAALEHHRPMAGGHHARRFDALEDLDRSLRAWPDATAVEAMRAAGVAVVLEHPPLARLPDLPGVHCLETLEHRICTVDGARVEDPVGL